MPTAWALAQAVSRSRSVTFCSFARYLAREEFFCVTVFPNILFLLGEGIALRRIDCVGGEVSGSLRSARCQGG
jgi:hypothetical protein